VVSEEEEGAGSTVADEARQLDASLDPADTSITNMPGSPHTPPPLLQRASQPSPASMRQKTPGSAARDEGFLYKTSQILCLRGAVNSVLDLHLLYVD
jgi:hypothetical protein